MNDTERAERIAAIKRKPVGLLRRLGAMTYDTLLLCGIVIIAAIPPVLINGGSINNGDGAMSLKELLFFCYWFGLIFLFYGWFWTHGGQTIGMVAWKHRIETTSGQPVSWQQSFVRAAAALFGLSNLSIYLNEERRGWHEKLSGTKLVRTVTSRLPNDHEITE